ncbi:hypothetical protein ACIBU0_42355 [Streptomyces sp. NPDC049627]|uniref:hypothetical protein n=1 Tax=Streptomyces sp. NPDC049627 TaxID=3365595 RepID=UPI0037B5C443
MSDPVSCPKPAPCSRETPCPRCARFLRVMVVCWGLILVMVVAILASVVVQNRGSSSDPEPAPSTQAPADPSPSAPPTSEPPRPTPSPTAPMPSDPPTGGCNIFDPECSSTGGTSGGTEA